MGTGLFLLRGACVDQRKNRPVPIFGLTPSVGPISEPLSRDRQISPFLLPERFRAGCAFGGCPVVPNQLSPAEPYDGWPHDSGARRGTLLSPARSRP